MWGLAIAPFTLSMTVNIDNYSALLRKLQPQGVTLVAVSKLKPVSAIRTLYELGHRDFGENYVQELVDKKGELPGDLRWHFIGHLQRNKVSFIAPFVHLIHGVDSFKLLKEINKEALKNNRTISVLLQVRIAEEETKFGLEEDDLEEIFKLLAAEPLANVAIKGFMGMASFSDDKEKVRREFASLSALFSKYSKQRGHDHPMEILSMGMSDDYELAVGEGSNMVRIGSLVFGSRSPVG